MILQALVNLYKNLVKSEKVSRQGWCKAKVSYAIHLSKEGTVTGILSLKKEEDRGKKKVLVPIQQDVPEMVTRSSGVAANFLCDNSKYILGIEKDGITESAMDRFSAARERHLELLQELDDETAQAVCLFFKTWDPRTAKENREISENWEELTEGGNLVFFFDEQFAQDRPAICEAWEKSKNISSGQQGICLVTGEKTEISRIHKSIKGVPGAQSSGAALVSFNAPSFESYGKEQSYNAPVGKYAEFAYTTALNYLLSQNDYNFQLGDSRIVFWAESGEEAYQDLFLWAADSKPDNEEELKNFFNHLKKQEAVDVHGITLDPEQKFYILALAPNAARLSVRFFYANSFGNIMKNLSEHYDRLRMIKPVWETREYLGVRDLLFETVNKKAKEKTPISGMAAMVLQAILSGNRYPESLFTDTLIRIRAEQGEVTWGRASILKAYFIRNKNWEKGENFMELNYEEKESKAYVLGRLFAVLESVQTDANPGINATIRDRYFNSACASPAMVFPILIKLKNSHMKKLERENAGVKIRYEQLLTEIIGKLGMEFPRRLSLEDQGKFILGYYHQVQKKYEKKEDK